jgi:transcription elongation factor GreA
MKPPQKIPFTQEGLDKIHQDILQHEQNRVEVLVRLQTAREMGDLSENGAYKAAKWELGGIDRELRRLRYLSRMGFVSESKGGQTIGFGSQVKVTLNGRQNQFMLVNEFESNPNQGKISVDSPIGQALMGKKAGDSVTVSAPAGLITYKIDSVT